MKTTITLLAMGLFAGTATMAFFANERSGTTTINFSSNGWVRLTYDDFEKGWGSFAHGPKGVLVDDKSKDTNYAHQGDWSAAVYDDAGESSSFYFADGIDVDTPGYKQIRISFWFKPRGFVDGRDWYLEYYDGRAWVVIGHYFALTDFINDQFYLKSITLREGDYAFPVDMKFRFRCDANSPSEAVHVDEIQVEASREAGKPNKPPVAKAQHIEVTEDAPQAVPLTATDADNNSLKYEIRVHPRNGKISGSLPDATYTPNPGYVGADQFSFAVHDGQDESTAAVTIVVWPKPELRLRKVFTDHMVLQRRKPAAIWGWALPGKSVTVSFYDKSVSTTASAEGKWSVSLPAMEADGQSHTLMVKSESDQIVLEDVVLGEVWFAAGQSNMARNTKGKKDLPDLRLFRIPDDYSMIKIPREDDLNKSIGWERATLANMGPEGVFNGRFSEVAYEFARELQENLKVPVGVMAAAVGGTTAEQWTPVKNPCEVFTFGIPNAVQAGTWYYSMVRGAQPFTLRGFVWWQGENDGNQGATYYKRKQELITSWRQAWGAPDAPFYFVQIMPTTYQRMAELWVSQQWVADNVPNTGMAPNNDIWDTDPDTQGTHKTWGFPTTGSGNPHPPNKHIPATRMAHAALRHTYQLPGGEVYGPTYKSHEVVGEKIRVTFKHAGKGLTTNDGKPPNWFLVGPKHPSGNPPPQVERYYDQLKPVLKPAIAKILDADTVEITVPDGIDNPGHLLYGYDNTARVNLLNSEGLPAVCFRLKLGQEPGLPDVLP